MSDVLEARPADDARSGSLSWSRTVDRELVHRSSVAEVLLTDVRPRAPGEFLAAACWGRSHPTFPRGRDDRHSPWMVAETTRQLGIYVPLRHYAVPGTARFLVTDLCFTLDPAAEPRPGHGASEITCRVWVHDVRTARETGLVTGLRMRVSYQAGGTVFATAAGGARFLDAAAYAALRAGARPAAPSGAAARPEPAVLGLWSPADVVLSLAGDGPLLDPADHRHPFLFDHETDHVPGMALLEAARQAAALDSAGTFLRPTFCHMKALRFTEHCPRARVECSRYGRTAVFRFRQNGAVTAAGVLRYG
ncbi:A-factor biosynthesis protein [Streptomyces pactum]|uniref:A-factor biosynthesis protein n=1 Tax=Streptomyces pactum TaxID=68249 RepID=A0ABS0NTX6_9ACTN|nr:ScbA/BarX family gamma-butyrolactone biosynthesis protein [Streptomyces pactum]MBH5338645.1 A-factor biosynthesis protein [Streptomyces pactum]